MKSLFTKLTSNVEQHLLPLYNRIWTDKYPKKVKFFCWELGHNAVNTQGLVQKMHPHIVISPNCCYLFLRRLKHRDTYLYLANSLQVSGIGFSHLLVGKSHCTLALLCFYKICWWSNISKRKVEYYGLVVLFGVYG